MTGLIKSNAERRGLEVRPFPPPKAGCKTAEETEGNPELVALKAEMNRLVRQLAARDAQIAEHESALAEACQQGEVAGRLAAERAFEEDRAEHLEQLKAALGDARSAFSNRLASLEALALLVAREVLDKLLGDPDRYRDLLAAMIAEHVSRIDRASVVSIEVSSADFPDVGEIAALEAAVCGVNGKLIADEAMPRGSCRIRLQLGTLEVGLVPQWPRIRELIGGMGELDADCP